MNCLPYWLRGSNNNRFSLVLARSFVALAVYLLTTKKTAEAVEARSDIVNTRLKQGVNERVHSTLTHASGELISSECGAGWFLLDNSRVLAFRAGCETERA